MVSARLGSLKKCWGLKRPLNMAASLGSFSEAKTSWWEMPRAVRARHGVSKPLKSVPTFRTLAMLAEAAWSLS